MARPQAVLSSVLSCVSDVNQNNNRIRPKNVSVNIRYRTPLNLV